MPAMSSVCIGVEKLYEKDDRLKKDDVRILTEWLKKQPHLPHLEEMQVAVFLHSCYYRTEPAKITIDKYFTRRTRHPEIFNFLYEDILRRTLSVVFINILPKTTPQGYAVLLLKLVDFKPENFNFFHAMSVVGMVTTLYMHQRGFESGGLAVFDCKGFTLSHMTKFNLSALKTVLDHVQEGAPVRIKGIHFINVSPVMDKVMMMIKPLLSSEIFSSLQLHKSIDTFFKYVPPECFPEDYGGKVPSTQILQEKNLTNMLENFKFFEWHDGQKVDESKRLEKTTGDIFGIDGTFKKLQID